MPAWRLLFSPPLPGADNMAIDEALMERARRTGECVLRVYTWQSPTVSFGRNQSALGRYDPARIAARGFDVVRRPTGGRAILHHREVTYSVTAPVGSLGSLRESYGRINRLLVSGLARLGVRASLDPGTARAPLPTESPCFERPVAGELVVDGRKLAGSAQWRENGALLQHGSILVEDDQRTLADLLFAPPAAPPAPATLREALGRQPEPEEVADALFAAARDLEDPGAAMLEPDSVLHTMVESVRSRYVDAGWTWRR